MSHPLVSIIIPCFNNESFVGEAIESALGQSYPSKEVVVVNDGSTDGSLSEIEAFLPRVRIVDQVNGGLSFARNEGIKIARGELLAFLDADDYWRSDFLERMVSALEDDCAGIAYCGWQHVGNVGARGAPFVPQDYEGANDKLEKLLIAPRWPVHAAVVRRDLVESVGCFGLEWTRCADFALWLFLGARTRLVRVPEVLAYYRHHDREQLTKSKELMALNHWRIQRRFLRENPSVSRELGGRRVREITHGELLRRAYECYWRRDLDAARRLFRVVMVHLYGRGRDWVYMLPSWGPLWLHERLIRQLECTEARNG